MTATHRINESFMQDLQHGMLNPLLSTVREDDTLMLGLRGSYVTVYYRGCQLVKLEQKGECKYSASFDKKYDKLAILPGDFFNRELRTLEAASECVSSLAHRKQLIDRFLGASHKHEREFQQLVVRENNRSSIANSTEYFITDIEHASGNARFDMLGVRWLGKERKSGDALVPVIAEMKFGNQALNGTAGLKEHLVDVEEKLKDAKIRQGLICNIESQFEQLGQLGLLDFNRSEKIEKFTIADPERVRPIVVLLLAGYNPRSDSLMAMLPQIKDYANSDVFDLRFFVSTFAGYAMHEACMLKFEEFSALLQRLHEITSQYWLPVRAKSDGG